MMNCIIDGGNMTARLNIEIDEDVKKAAQKRAIDNGTSLRQIVTEAIQYWLGIDGENEDDSESDEDRIPEESDLIIS